jgi:hypothetical protein
MSFILKSPRRLRVFALLAYLIAVIGSSLAGCSHGVGAGAPSAEDYAKAKENFKKRSSNFSDKTNGRKTSR